MASFHTVRHRDGTLGGIVPCESDPCTIHGDDDIHADTLEEAYSIAYGGDAAPGRREHGCSHPVMPKRRWDRLKRTAATLMAVTVVSSLAACGADRPYYDNTGVSPGQGSSPKTVQPEDAGSGSDSGDGRTGKSNLQAPSGEQVGDALSHAKSKARDYLERSRKRLEDMSANGGGTMRGVDADGVPASLDSNSGITRADLESLTVVPDHGRSPRYVRRQWSNGRFMPYGVRSCWSVRDEVIKRQADPGTLRVTPDGCAVEAVSFTDPYSGRRIQENGRENVERNIQIDHVVPVSYMASNGGNDWDQATRDRYFNDTDPGHLLAVASVENNLKSDSGPSRYMPTAGVKYRTAYAKDWVAVLKSYQSKGVTATIERSDYEAIMHAFDEGNVQ